MTDTVIIVATDGTIRYIHHDKLTESFAALGPVRIRRASYVEPDEHGHWYADLSPVGGPKLGPFPSHGRQDALQAETLWLTEHYIPFPSE